MAHILEWMDIEGLLYEHKLYHKGNEELNDDNSEWEWFNGVGVNDEHGKYYPGEPILIRVKKQK